MADTTAAESMTTDGTPFVVVAGHLCLDIIPTFDPTQGAPSFAPGKLIRVDRAVLSTGGAVSNTGIALHRLGIKTRLMGKIGDDLFGRAILDLVRTLDPILAQGMIVDAQADTSYTVVINPPGQDRMFLHAPGANDTFAAADVPMDAVRDAHIFHFGYPPIMRRIYLDDGAQLTQLLADIRARGVTISLDMALPDPNSEAGRVDWRAVLRHALPHVDIFLPSLEETAFMLARPVFDALSAADGWSTVELSLLRSLTDELLEMGAAVVGLKLGDQGLYLRTTADPARLADCGRAAPHASAGWLNREILAPCFDVPVVGTTGAGDCTIAGFLAALIHGLPLDETVTTAVAVGAFNVESADATSGIPDWPAVAARVQSGRPRRPLRVRGATDVVASTHTHNLKQQNAETLP